MLGIPGQAVKDGLEAFSGAGRRCESKGEYHGARVYDDYAHHPSELHALLEMAKSLDYRRVVCVFQPHTYTRTKALFDDFVRELKAADLVVDIGANSREEAAQAGISSQDLAERIPGALYRPSLPSAAEALRELAREGDLILTVGAGNVFAVGEMLVETGAPACE